MPPLSRPLLVCLALAVGLAAGCEEAREADLLEVRSVGPSEIDPGHPIVIEGGPFAIHHAVSVRLVGELARAFEAIEPIDRVFAAQAVTEERIEVSLGERVLATELRRATFRGHIEVREEASWEGMPGAVLGQSDEVVIDFVPPRAMDSSERSLDRFLGVTWTLESERGLTIDRVAPESRAASMGIEPGDAILGEGAASFVPGDAPRVTPGAETATFRVLRPGSPERALTLLIGEHSADDAARDLARLVQLAIVIAWIALLAALPMRSLDYGAARPAAALARPTAALAARAGASLVIAYALLRASAAGTMPSIPVTIAALGGLRAGLLFADARGELRVLPTAVLSGLGLTLGLAALPIAAGTADLAALATDAAPSPLDWPLFAQPCGPVAIGLIGASFAAGRAERRVAAFGDDVLVVAASTLAVIEGTSLATTTRTGIVAAVLSIALVSWCLGHARGRLGTGAAAVAIGTSTVVGAGFLGAWTLSDPSALTRQTAAETVLVMTIALVLAVARRALTPSVPARLDHALL